MQISKVTVLGSGVLGAQIAFQTAYMGFEVTVYDINEESLGKAKVKFNGFEDIYRSDLQADDSRIKATWSRLHATTELAAAVEDADLTIEAIPENLELKKSFYEKLNQVAPAKTIFATNTSTLLPSQFAASTGRPEKFLALHFANEIWKRNTAEIMGHAGTDPAVFQQIVEFAKAIGMVALPIYKEQPGYILNSLLSPWCVAAIELLVTGVADAETIDKTWMIAAPPAGPFALYDAIGIGTIYNILRNYGEHNALHRKAAEYIKTEFLDKGKLGMSSGEGFYQYPHPKFEQVSFLQ